MRDPENALSDVATRTRRQSGLRRSVIPRGSQEIRVMNPRDPERPILVGAHDASNVYFWRDKDRRHYPVRKTELLGVDLSEAMTALEDEARRTHRLVNDVAREVIAGVHGGYEQQEAQRVLSAVRGQADGLPAQDWIRIAADGLRLFRRIERLAVALCITPIELLEQIERQMAPSAP